MRPTSIDQVSWKTSWRKQNFNWCLKNEQKLKGRVVGRGKGQVSGSWNSLFKGPRPGEYVRDMKGVWVVHVAEYKHPLMVLLPNKLYTLNLRIW